MEKKSSVSSRPEKLVRMKAEAIFDKPLTAEDKAMLERLRNKTESEIDYSDIPELTDEQLAEFKPAAKVLVAARIDRDVYNWLRKFGEGYSTRINGILRAVMEQQSR
jgi:uncharacterized protein (DUF4415 family)